MKLDVTTFGLGSGRHPLRRALVPSSRPRVSIRALKQRQSREVVVVSSIIPHETRDWTKRWASRATSASSERSRVDNIGSAFRADLHAGHRAGPPNRPDLRVHRLNGKGTTSLDFTERGSGRQKVWADRESTSRSADETPAESGIVPP